MNYAGLQTSIANWAARSDSVTTDEIPTFIEFATAGFNWGIPDRSIAPLRLRDMEETATVSMTNGIGALPSDYLQYKTARSMAATPNALDYATSSYTNAAYPDSAAGVSSTFSITGSTLYVLPVSAPDVELVYYAAIPDLSDTNTSNWLLAKMPALYLHASLMHLGIFTNNNTLLSRSQALVTAMIDGLNETNTLSTFAKAGSRMGMLTP